MMVRTLVFVLFVVPAQATAAVLTDALISWDYTNTIGGVSTSDSSLGYVPVDGTGNFNEGASLVSLQAATTTEPTLSVSGAVSGSGEGLTGSISLVWEATVVDKSNPASTASVDLLVMGTYGLTINADAGEFSGGGTAGTTGDALSSIAFAQANVNGLGLLISQ